MNSAGTHCRADLEKDSERDSTGGSKEDTVIIVSFVITVWTVTIGENQGFLVYGQ